MLDSVERMACTYFQGARGSHDWDHTLRVRRLCERIGAAEGVDMDVLLASAYLHDIARSQQDDSDGAVCHAEKGAQLASSIVNKLPLFRNISTTTIGRGQKKQTTTVSTRQNILNDIQHSNTPVLPGPDRFCEVYVFSNGFKILHQKQQFIRGSH